MNNVTITGVVPSFDNSCHFGNIEDENKAYFHGRLSVKGFTKDDNGKYLDDLIEFSAFRRHAQNLSKWWKKGTGFELQGYIAPSRQITDKNGQAVVTSEGKKVYTGTQIMITRIEFARNYSERNSSSNNNASNGNAGTNNTVVDPMSMFGTNEQNTAAAPAASKGSEDFGADWPF